MDAFSLNRFATFWQDDGRTMDLDNHKEYQDWLASIVSEPDASTIGNGRIPVSQMSASCDAAAGWRGVLRADLLEKVRVQSLAKAWQDAAEDKFLLFLPSQKDHTGQRYWHVHGHHRGCDLHAMLAFYFCMADKGFELPCWLAKMAGGGVLQTSQRRMTASLHDWMLRRGAWHAH